MLVHNPVYVLAGAFTISNPVTRSVIRDPSIGTLVSQDVMAASFFRRI
jgi:hypothetical protein